MNYTDIIDLALSYSDREDSTELSDNMDKFLRVAESTINRKLKVQNATVRSQLITDGSDYYGLPDDYGGLRDIEIFDPAAPTKKRNLKFLTPSKANDYNNISTDDNLVEVYYSIIGNQLQIIPAQTDDVIEVVYYKKVPPLTDTNTTNWLSDDDPDCYVFALMVEISAFIKNSEAVKIWNARFKEVMNDIVEEDVIKRWPNTPLQITLGD